MIRAEQYRQHAREAERQAQRAPDRDAKEGLQDIARQWRELAEQAERRELEGTEAWRPAAASLVYESAKRPLGLAGDARVARFVADRSVDMIRDRLGWETVGLRNRSLRGLGTPPFPRHTTPDAEPCAALAMVLLRLLQSCAEVLRPKSHGQMPQWAGIGGNRNAAANETISKKRQSPRGR
jgi:hypothetical protein